MSKKDILTPIGITFGFIVIMLAILSSGGTEGAVSFIDVSSILIVIGGLIASMLIAFKMEQLKLIFKLFKATSLQNSKQLPELIALFLD